MAKRTRVSKRATNHFILNWNKMIEAKGDGKGGKSDRDGKKRAMA